MTKTEGAKRSQLMGSSEGWMLDLDEYIREGEPGQAERAGNWQIAIGLQAVDGLKTSDYLLETAKDHIEGRIDIAQVQQRIKSYYEEHASRKELEDSHEADTVSSRISEVLGERAFTFSPAELCDIHRRLFDEVILRAGKYRTYNITKKEWVLKGDTVYYATHNTIAEALKYDFDRERDFSYLGLSDEAFIQHIASFVSGVWQVHPFPEGNTRTTAVFTIKYLRSMGYTVENDTFEERSWYFRNALVRANYENHDKGIHEDRRFLELFFENLLLDAHHDLKNRYLHIDWPAIEAAREASLTGKETSKETDGTSKETGQTSKETSETSKETDETGKETSKETGDTSKETDDTGKEMRDRILAILRENPASSAISIAERVDLTPQGVRYHLDALKKAGLIHHEGPTKSGKWVVHDRG